MFCHSQLVCAVAAAVAIFVALPETQVVAQDVSGLAAMHDMRREGKRLCMSDHFHYGSSTGQSNKKAAQAAAIASWADFTAFEYGGAWASYAKSAGKQMTCSQATSGWGCDVSSRPCR